MKIGMLTTFYPPYNFGGDGIFVYRLANTLAKAGHEVHVLYDQDAFTFLNADPPTQTVANHANIQLHPLTSGRTASLDMLLTHQAGSPVFKREAIQTILDREAFDVLHFHNVSLLGGPGVLKMGHAIKLVTLHDYWFVCATHVLWPVRAAPVWLARCTLTARRKCGVIMAGWNVPSARWMRLSARVAFRVTNIESRVSRGISCIFLISSPTMN